MKIAVVTPVYQLFHEAHAEARKVLLQSDLGVEWINEAIFGMSSIPWARNYLTEIALARGADYLLWIDADIGFRIEDVKAMIDANLPIVAMPCTLSPRVMSGPANLNYCVFPDDPPVRDEDIWHVRAIGCGMMLVKAEVFYALRRIKPPYVDDWFLGEHYPELSFPPFFYEYFSQGVRDVDGSPRYVGEDYSFCYDAGRVGYPVFLYGGGVTSHHHLGRASYCDFPALRKQVKDGTAVVKHRAEPRVLGGDPAQGADVTLRNA